MPKKRKIITKGTLKMERRTKNQSFASKCVKNLRKKATPYEKKFYTMLKAKNISVVFQKAFIRPEGIFIVDFFFPYKGIIIELDGSHHYRDEKHIRRDAKRDFILGELGYRIIRIKNTEVDYIDIETLLNNL